MLDSIYILSSLDSITFEPARKCTFLRKLYFPTGKECVLAKITPPVIGQLFNTGEDIEYIVLTNRHEGGTLDPINEFPCFVFIGRPLIDISKTKQVNKDDLEIMAWGELYRTESDADNHVLD